MPPHLAIVAGVDRAASGPQGAPAARGLRGVVRQIPPPQLGCSSEPLYAGALPPLWGGAPALLPERHHRRGGLRRGV